MADKMAALLPASPAAAEAEAARPIPGVRLVCAWALLTSLAYALAYTLNRYDAVPGAGDAAEVAKVDALLDGMRWYAAPQALAAALALLLPRCCRALTCVALAAAAVGHCMFASAVLAAGDPGDHLFRVAGSAVISVLAVGDVLGFLVLLLGGDEWRQSRQASGTLDQMLARDGLK